MKTRGMHLAILLASLAGVAQVQAAEGYWTDSSGEVWRNSASECWHESAWNMDMAIVGCDGKVAEVAEPEPAPAPPPPAPAPAMMSVDGTVNFGFDRADMDGNASAKIDELVSKAGGKIKSVRLTGHADRIGTEDYNQDLSLRRASAVSDYLVQKGVDAQAIEIGGRGESEPLVGCEGQRGAALIQCLAPNRRVDIDMTLF